MEPNQAGLANCVYCGMPLHADASGAEAAQDLAAADAEQPRTNGNASAESPSPKTGAPQTKKLNKNFTYAIRGMGLYLIISAISELPRSLKIEKQEERTLSIISNVIYLVAGVMIAWPMIKEFLEKRKKKATDQSLEINTAEDQPKAEALDGEAHDPAETVTEPLAESAPSEEISSAENKDDSPDDLR